MDDLISRQAAIEAIDRYYKDKRYITRSRTILSAICLDMKSTMDSLPSAQPDNQVHLCDSCKYTYPECPSGSKDVIYGNGKGNDNICACNKYEPSAQPEIIRCKDCKWYSPQDNECDKFQMLVRDTDYCTWAAKMEE